VLCAVQSETAAFVLCAVQSETAACVLCAVQKICFFPNLIRVLTEYICLSSIWINETGLKLRTGLAG